MYVLYDVTFSTEIDLQKEENNGILPTTVTLSGVGEVSKAGKGGSVYTIGINGQTITYLSYFESNLDQYPEGDLLLTLGQFKAGGKTEATPSPTRSTSFPGRQQLMEPFCEGILSRRKERPLAAYPCLPFL